MNDTEALESSQHQPIRFGVRRKNSIFQVVLMAYFLCLFIYMGITDGLSVWYCFLLLIFAVTLVLGIWQLTHRQTFGGVDANGVTLYKQFVPWNRINEVRIYAVRPTWLYEASPQRVYAFVTDQLPDGKESRTKSRFFRNALKRYGTPFVISEMLVFGTEDQFRQALNKLGSVDLVQDPAAPLRAKWYDIATFGGVVAGIGLPIGFTAGIGSELFSVKGIFVFIVDIAIFSPIIALWRYRLRKLRATAPGASS